MMYWGNDMSTAGWVFSIFGTLFILGLLVAAITWAIWGRGGQAASGATPIPSTESAREILDRRLANSELNPEQYNQLRAMLADDQAAIATQPTTSAEHR